jgi:DNA adenine methylase
MSFLKWPGGKRWFVGRHADMLPTTFGRYFEPFLGGASVFFHLKPERAVLADCNAELIAVYSAVAWRRKILESLLLEHQKKHGKVHYYHVRDNVPVDPVERAARTLYLNRTCFNGMYRVNLAGEFNVPKGTRTAVVMDLASSAGLLRRADLRVSDFEAIIDEADTGDLVFADPPYIVGHNNNGFVKYNEILFKWSDQERLAKTLIRAKGRGVKIVATNAAHFAIEELYRKGGFNLTRVERYCSISGTPVNRKRFLEVVIRANCSKDLPCPPSPHSNRLPRRQVTREARFKH